jgi:hypothetical protein
MERLKRFEDFLYLKEEETTAMVVANASAKVAGPNYDGKGTIFMPAGKYTINTSNKVKYTIENTSTSNFLFLQFSKPRDGALKVGLGGEVYFSSHTGTYYDKGSTKGKPLGFPIGITTNVSIAPGAKIEFEMDVKFSSKFTPSKDGTPLFDMSIGANVLKGTTPWSTKNGEIIIEWGWKSDVSYF